MSCRTCADGTLRLVASAGSSSPANGQTCVGKRCAEASVAETIALATRLGLRIAAAESLTGGLVAAALVSVPGASLAFSGGVVAYDTELKASLLGVDRALLARRGPVDGEVARQMARGVRRVCAVPRGPADLGIATTGVAGPDPDPQSGQVAGTVWLGVSSALGERAVLLDPSRIAGTSRQEIREAAVQGALELLLEELRALPGARDDSSEPS